MTPRALPRLSRSVCADPALRSWRRTREGSKERVGSDAAGAGDVQPVCRPELEEPRHHARHTSGCELPVTLALERNLPGITQTLRGALRVLRRRDGIRGTRKDQHRSVGLQWGTKILIH